jgi:hypothetical protein
LDSGEQKKGGEIDGKREEMGRKVGRKVDVCIGGR